ncbi:MAG: substrate-binding domain-containing protein [Motiliproteus sp.]
MHRKVTLSIGLLTSLLAALFIGILWSMPLAAMELPLKVFVIPKGMSNQYWKIVQRGAEQAGRDLGVTVTFRGPGDEDNRQAQGQLIRSALDNGYQGIVLAPGDESMHTELLQQVRARGVRTVIIDSTQQGSDYDSFIATDNYRVGTLAAEEMLRLLGGKGRVLLFRFHAGSASTDQREQGFIDRLKGSGIEVIGEAYAGVSLGSAARSAHRLLDRYPDAQGVFTPDESSTEGLVLALKSRGMQGQIKVIGMDYNPRLLRALDEHYLDALFIQRQYLMGYQGVETVVNLLRGNSISARTLFEPLLVNRENRADPEISELLRPLND